ncbi:MAG: sulfotransferase [Acidobacteriaceae bacterium]|jgi:Sulfotransferase domain
MPSFIVVGPPRTGTSWLHQVFRHHTILPAPTKETRFFDLHFSRGLHWYLSHFPRSGGGQPVGEIAPTYFASAAARTRIESTLPGAKLIFIFRHPVQRLISLYRLKRAYGTYRWSLEEALERDSELLSSGQYATHLRDWQGLFPSEQLSINFFDDLSSDPRAFVRRLSDFLNVPRFDLHESQLRQVYSVTSLSEPRSYLATRAATTMADWCKARRFDHVVSAVRESSLFRFFVAGGPPFPEINDATASTVSARLLPEIEEMEAMVNRDLSNWKTWPPVRGA